MNVVRFPYPTPRLAAEMLWEGAPLAHVVQWEERQRLARIERQCAQLARRANRR